MYASLISLAITNVEGRNIVLCLIQTYDNTEHSIIKSQFETSDS